MSAVTSLPDTNAECVEVLAKWHPIILKGARRLHRLVHTIVSEEELIVTAQYECWKAHVAGVTAPSSMAMTLRSRLIDYVRKVSPVRRGRYRRLVDANKEDEIFPLSLDAPISANYHRDASLAAFIPDQVSDGPSEAAQRVETIAAVQAGIDRLEPRDALVVRRRMAGLTFAEIGEEIGVTESRVCQIWKRLEEELRWVLRDVPRKGGA